MAALSEPERRAAFLLRLRAAGVRDLQVLRAMEAVPRSLFFPGVDPETALRDIVLPLPGGQAAERPSWLALGLEALGVQPGQRVLEVGTGSGYVTALLTRMGARVTSLDRRRLLVETAGKRLAALGLVPEALACADFAAHPVPAGSFARIVIHIALAAPPARLFAALEPEGRLLFTTDARPRRLMLVRVAAEGLAVLDVGASTAITAAGGLSS